MGALGGLRGINFTSTTFPAKSAFKADEGGPVASAARVARPPGPGQSIRQKAPPETELSTLELADRAGKSAPKKLLGN